MSDRIDALEALLASPGWQLYYERAKAEWGPSACWRKVKEQNGELAKVDYTNEQVGQLLEWPAQELMRLKRQVQPAPELTFSRRGGL